MARTIAIVEDEGDILANYVGPSSARDMTSFPSGTAHRRPKRLQHACRIWWSWTLASRMKLKADSSFASTTQPLRELANHFLTAHDSDLDTISGLRLGADDYITKDVSIAQLLARVAALLRRVEALRTPVEAGQVLERGRTVVDQDRMQVSYDGQVVALTITEFWPLYSLVRYPGHVKNRDQLMQDAGVVVDDGTITSHVKRIRKKFQLVAADFDCIETVYGAGYRWVCDS